MSSGQSEQPGEGWTHVSKGKGRAKGKPPVYLQGLDPPMRGITAETIRADFDRKLRRWRASSCRRQILEILERQQPDEGWQIGDAICLASGSFSRDNWQNTQRSVTQFVTFLDVVEHLRKAQSRSICCYVQEPQYTSLDKAFLASLGVTVLDHELTSGNSKFGAAAQHLNSSSFVFEPFMELGAESMREVFGAEVKLYIGSSMDRWIQLAMMKDAETDTVSKECIPMSALHITPADAEQTRAQAQRAAEFVRSRRSYRFPRFEEDPNVFDGLSIYWKEPQDEDVE